MKTKLLVAIFAVLTIFLVFSFIKNEASSNSAGPAGGYTGSPGDAQNCTACHTATLNNVTGWITSNIPANGYNAGTTYTITATATQTGASKFGFEISPQLTTGNPLGQMVGTLLVTNTTETKLSSTASTNDNKYITHRAAGTTGSDTRTWSFNWQAPTSNLKSVTFYGAFKIGTSATTNTVYLSSHTKAPNLSGIDEEAYANAIGLTIFPNPASENITVSFLQNKQNEVTVQLFDLNGKLIQTLCEKEKILGDFSCSYSLSNLEKGVYILVLGTSENSCSRRIVVTK